MPAKKSSAPSRFRVGKVSVYEHHGAWWVYYRDGAGPHRKKVAADRTQAEQVAARVNSQLASNEPTLLTFTPVGVAELRAQFLGYHEHVLHSSVATLKRYRSATQHLADFVGTLPRPPHAHEVKVEAFAAYLRRVEVAPNGHANTAKRRLLSKGVQYVLETCRAMYAYALRKRHLPPYAGNPFAELPLDKIKADDSKPVFVFGAATELAFLRACPEWAFPVHFTLAKTGLRVGELVHLLVEDIDFEGGWLHVRNKVELGWRVKSGRRGVTASTSHYYVTSRRGTAAELGRLVRRHWAVENELHWCLDVSFREDSNRTAAGHAGANLGLVRRVAASLIKQDTAKGSVKAKRLTAAWDDGYLLRLLQGTPTV